MNPRALAAINGGFFDDAGAPIGWIVSNGVEVSRPSPRGWGVIAIHDDGTAEIRRASEARALHAVNAVQAGPRLVIHGVVHALKPQSAVRSFVGMDARGRLVLGTTSPWPVDATDLARFLAAPEAEGGAGLVDALNLDGGGSSQLWARHAGDDGGELLVPGLARVPDLLVVVAK